MWGRAISRFRGISRLVFVSVFSMAINKLNTNLFGESKLHILASRGSKLGDALLRSFSGFFDLRNSDTLLSSQIFTRYSHQADWLVDTGLDWLRVGNLNSWLNNSYYRDIVASLLSNLLAVVMSVSTIATVSIALRSWLADGHHLYLAFLCESNFNSLGICSLNPLLVRVGADLIVNLLNTLGTNSTGYWVALLFIHNFLNSKFYWVAHCLKSRGANLSRFNNIVHGAVVLGVLIVRNGVCWCRGITVGRGWDMGAIGRGRVAIGRGWGRMAISWGWVGISRFNRGVSRRMPIGKLGCKGQRNHGENCKDLKRNSKCFFSSKQVTAHLHDAASVVYDRVMLGLVSIFIK